jgi:HKD family nuclease
MRTDVELMFLPYAGATQETLVDVLIREFASGKWSSFSAAVAFARESGNYRELLVSLTDFARGGGTIEMTFGANRFAEGEGSDYRAIEALLRELGDFPNVHLYLYEQPDRTFHPKLYLFASQTHALLIIGSSNWTQGGFQRNVEANVLLRLDLSDREQKGAYDRTVDVFHTYWREIQ